MTSWRLQAEIIRLSELGGSLMIEYGVERFQLTKQWDLQYLKE